LLDLDTYTNPCKKTPVRIRINKQQDSSTTQKNVPDSSNSTYFAICIFLPKAHVNASETPPISFHHLSFCPMALLNQRPEDVLDAGQPVFPVDLVAYLTAASTLAQSKVLAEEMDHLSFVNDLYLTKDGMMWVPSHIDLRFEVV
jgi:hypothetical protein